MSELNEKTSRMLLNLYGNIEVGNIEVIDTQGYELAEGGAILILRLSGEPDIKL